MTIIQAVLCCLFTSFAVHYGWRMRGTVIGGEKGAMLPGLFAGLSLALFAGGATAEYFWIPAAAGLIGMSYGGIEPYGDSIAFIEDPNLVKPNPLKGYCGLALKGALWFSIAGGYIGLAMSAMGGRYSVRDIAAFIPFLIVLQFTGYLIFNQPYKPEKGIFPKIYLSFESRDEWGSNVGVLSAVLVLAVIRRDFLTLRMTGCGFLLGAVGWIVAMKLYYYVENPMKNGRFLFGALSKKRLIGGWGMMEYCLGSFGGLGVALGFVLSGKQVRELNLAVSENGLFSPLAGYETVAVAVLTVAFAALLIINIYEHRCDESGKSYNGFIMDCIERPFFNTIPYVLILLCSIPAAKLMTAFMIIYVLCIKNWFDRFKKEQPRKTYIAVSSLLCVVLYVLSIGTDGPSPLLVFICGGLPYILTELIWRATNKRYGGIASLKSFNNFTFGTAILFLQSTAVAVLGYVIEKKI